MILPAVHLTQRQRQIIALIAQGLSYCQIAAGLGISAHTVRFHASNATAALQAPNLHAAIAKAAYLRLIGPEQIFDGAGECKSEDITYFSGETSSTTQYTINVTEEVHTEPTGKP